MDSIAVQEILKSLPQKSGVYQFRDTSGTLLYVGKAKNLKNRVSSYFQKSSALSARIQSLVSQVADISVLVTHSEIEALVLESNLIKTNRPKYNILMRDDKKYPWLVLTNEPFPRLIVTREPGRKGRSFGPYATPGAMYETLHLIKKLFPLRQRKKPLFKDRPCMNYHIGSCLGPCQALVTEEDYQKLVDQVVLLLKGQADELLNILKHEMKKASTAMDFETAAALRDRIVAIHTITERQRVMVDDPTVEQDVIGVSWHLNAGYFTVLKVRHGKLIHTEFYTVTLEQGVTPQEAYQEFLFRYYQNRTDKTDLPVDIIVQYPLEDEAFLTAWLKEHKNRKAALYFPQRGQKKDILDMAQQNADALRDRSIHEQQSRLRHDPTQALLTLQERLKLPTFPRRIECYDISHVSGTNTVASMVVFTDGLPDKSEYRRFKIKTTEEGTPDDFKSMHEVITRRFSKDWPDPDLVIIDGGKGQLSSACQALMQLEISDQPIISLAKKFEEVFLPGQSKPVLLERDSMALYLLQQIRDEAHRFAITYHRSLRGKMQTQSFLDDIKGIGEVRKKRLLSHFKSLETLMRASLEEISEVTQTKGRTAQKLYDQLHQGQAAPSATS